MSGRKAYSCTPCRTRKVKCDRRRFCRQCERKSLDCVWPPNGVYLDEDEEEEEARAVLPSPRGTPNAAAGPSYSATPAPMVDVPNTVVSAEQLDHSILNDPHDASPGVARSPHRSSRARAFPFHSGAEAGNGMVTNALMKHLPSRTQADVLLERVEWIHHPLHLPTFLSQYNKFWAMDLARRRQTVHARWLALLYIILCLGDHFGDEDVARDSRLEGQLLMTIICLNLYLNNKNRASAARSLLGTAIKMAISMGMSRIPDESSATNPDDVIGRRLWWSLVTQDAYTASNSGFTYLINLSHASTNLFANVDDEDIRGGADFHSRPIHEVTTSAYHILKIDFALVVRRFIDAINADFPDASYHAIMDLDHQFRQVYDSLPAPFRPDLPQPFELSFAGSKRYLVEQRIFMGVTLHNRLMRLHRAYMVRGYDDPRYEYSTRVCLDSAYALLELVRQCPQTLCRWWVVLVHVWTGGLIIGADLVRGTTDEGTKQKQRDGIALAVSLLEPSSRSSPVAHRGVKVLKSLLNKSRREGDSRKRKHGEVDVLSDPSPQDVAVATLGDLEQLLRDAAPQASAYPQPVGDVAVDPALEFWQSLFEMNQW
ncbi:hypothetical protein IAT38_003082 [Cryptococcus sp. DSM 104549]